MTVNTDNRLVTDTTASQELWLCHTKMGFSLRDIKTIILAGFKSAFLPFHVKQGYMRKVNEELARFAEDGTVKAPPPAPSARSLDYILPRRGEPARTPADTKPDAAN
ncbi:MAG: hypothetical protein QM820_52075 [Minicystis sp.]